MRAMENLGATFLTVSRQYLTEDYFPRIASTVGELSPDDLWWRPNPASNAIGNLLLHLAGNARQWIVSGVGGHPDIRNRQAEFDARNEGSAPALLTHLSGVLLEVDDTLETFPPDRLGERRTIQGQDVTAFEAIYHVVEHFAMHTGQIQYIAKLRTGRDLGHYTVVDGIATPQWERGKTRE